MSIQFTRLCPCFSQPAVCITHNSHGAVGRSMTIAEGGCLIAPSLFSLLFFDFDFDFFGFFENSNNNNNNNNSNITAATAQILDNGFAVGVFVVGLLVCLCTEMCFADVWNSSLNECIWTNCLEDYLLWLVVVTRSEVGEGYPWDPCMYM